jgi:hypothetical protein
MSGVNRNILKNTGIPVMAQDQIPMSLVTTANSRFVLLDWPVKTYLTASEGGDCEGITVQWTTDPSLASDPDNAYPNLTSSVLSCNSSSQVPLTSSLGWSVFVDNGYSTGSSASTTYYMRSFQNSSGGGRGPYSNVVSLQTRYVPSVISNNYYYNPRWQNPQSSSLLSPGATGSVLVLNTQTFDPNTGTFKWWGDNTTIVPSESIQIKVPSGSLLPIKIGGPNLDGIQTNGATMSIALTASSGLVSGAQQFHTIQDGNFWYYNNGTSNQFDPCTGPGLNTYNFDSICGNPSGFLLNDGHMRGTQVSVGLISGSIEIIGNEGFYFKATATTSSVDGDFVIGRIGTKCGTLTNSTLVPNGTNSKNKIIYTSAFGGGCGNIPPIAGYQFTPSTMTVSVDEFTAYNSGISTSPTSSLGSNITINTSPDCVFSVLTFGTAYSKTDYDSQYGN